MASTVASLQTLIYEAIADNSAKATTLTLRGINIGHLLAALIFQPPELMTSGTLTVSGAGTSVSVSTLTRLNRIVSLYNGTASLPVYVWDDLLRFLNLAPSGAGHVEGACKFGTTLYTRLTPATDEVLTCYYTQFPAELTAGSSLAFINYDDFIIMMATQFYWMSLEETDNATAWGAFLDKISPTLQMAATVKGDALGVMQKWQQLSPSS